jgi:arginine:ornithine antiporter/lysine permease
MPSFLARQNAHNVPVGALWLTNFVIQTFLLVTWFAEYAFTLALKMTSAMTLIPYFFVAAYGLKLAWTGETYGTAEGARRSDGIRSTIATIYTAAMICAGGPKFLLLSSILYAPGTILFLLAKREQQQQVFRSPEAVIFATIVIAACAGVFALSVGAISI